MNYIFDLKSATVKRKKLRASNKIVSISLKQRVANSADFVYVSPKLHQLRTFFFQLFCNGGVFVIIGMVGTVWPPLKN